jgi:hypothetical protein
MAGNNLKQIKDFDLQSSVADTDLFVLQTVGGTTLNTTKSALLNDVNSSLVGLQSQIDSLEGTVIKGSLDLVIDQDDYTILNSNIREDSVPVCTIKTPSKGSTIPSIAIYDIISGGFSVELSCSPAISGYKLNYQI